MSFIRGLLNQFLNTVAISSLALSLMACQSSTPAIPADVIIENAHGGGSAVKFSSNESFLASGGWSGYIRLWNIHDGSKILSWKAHEGEVTGIYFTAGDKLMITSGYDGFIKFWSVQGQLLKQYKNRHSIRSMVVNEAHDLIITGHSNGIIRTWSLDKLLPVAERRQHKSAVRSVAYSADNRMIASSGSGGDVMLWPDKAASIKLPSPFTDIRTLVFADNGQVLLGGSWFKLYRWTLKEQLMQSLETDHNGIIRNMALLDGNSTLATISRQTDSAVILIDPLTGASKKHFQSHDLCGVDITISKNQNFLATTSDDSSVRIWHLHNTSKR